MTTTTKTMHNSTITAATFAEHPAASMFPLIDGDAFEALVADIREHGQREPIVRFHGKVLDGRNRLRACQQLGIEPKTIDLSDEQVGDPFAFVVSLNIHRRHLEPHQKGEILLRLMERVGAQTGKTGRTKKSDTVSDIPRTLPAVAKKLSLDERTARRHVQAAEDYRAAAPQLKAKVDAGQVTAKQARKATEAAKTTADDDGGDIQARLDAYVKQQQRADAMNGLFGNMLRHFDELLSVVRRDDGARDAARQLLKRVPELDAVLAAPAGQVQQPPECPIFARFIATGWSPKEASKARKLVLALPEDERERATGAARAGRWAFSGFMMQVQRRPKARLKWYAEVEAEAAKRALESVARVPKAEGETW